MAIADRTSPVPSAGSPSQARDKPAKSGRAGKVRRVPAGVLLPALIIGLIIACLFAAGIGQVPTAPGEVIGSILYQLGFDKLPTAFSLPKDPQGYYTLWSVRFPRVLMAVLVGMALGCAGAVMQGVFGNPLAEPGVIGVSSGAAVGAFSVIVFGISTFGNWTIAVAAFIGGLLTTLFVYALSRSKGRSEVVTLILTGIAVNALTGAVIGFFTFVSDDSALRDIAFWNLGSLSGSSWSTIWVVLPCLAVGLVIAMGSSRKLDLLALGEASARHLGVDVERLRIKLIVVVALLVASGVAFTGVIAFVGLVVPHIIRMIAGPGHRLLIPASAVGSALVLVLADLVARTVVPSQELPLGVLTALVGGPFFFYLLLRTRSAAGGWG